MLTWLLVGTSLGPLGCEIFAAQDSAVALDCRVIEGTRIRDDYRDMLENFLVAEAKKAAASRRDQMRALRSEVELRKWQEAQRRAFLKLIGGLPEERTPLNPRTTGELIRVGYVVRKVIFESLPEFYVTANLYVPTAGKPPYPAVLCPLGHSRNGKAYETYQHLFIGLAQRGYVVLTWDPIGQGERIEYWDFLSNRRLFEFNQHAMAGIQQYLLGQNLARYFIWDGIRALDYLTSLPEVDASRVGVTGSSGGGTLSTYLSMLDARIKVAAIITFITSLPWKIERRINDAESDPEQDVHGLLAAGLDHPEFLAMIAPRPVLIGAATRDFFPIEGTRETFKEVQAFYARLGIPERLKMVEFDHRHMYSQPLREAATAWFEGWLKGTEGEVHEPAITPEPEAALLATATGLAQTSLGGKRVFDFNRQEAERLLKQLESARREPSFRASLAARIRSRLALPESPAATSAISVGEVDSGDVIVERMLLETESGIVVPLRVIRQKTAASRLPAVLYLRDRRGDRDSPELFLALARQRRLVAVADVRGFGETMSSRNVPEAGVDYFDPRDGMDADYTYASFFLGRPLLGMRVTDALQVARYLRSRADVDATRLGIAGCGWAGPVALFAAAADRQFAWAVVEGVPSSYGEIARSEVYAQPVGLMLPGALADFDHEDVMSALAPSPLLVMNPQDAMGRKLSRDEAKTDFTGVARAYQAGGNPKGFATEVVPLDARVGEVLGKWILAR